MSYQFQDIKDFSIFTRSFKIFRVKANLNSYTQCWSVLGKLTPIKGKLKLEKYVRMYMLYSEYLTFL